jgi:AcrR family transcriptional regulator
MRKPGSSEPSKSNLIRAARTVIGERGLEGVRVREIASQAGVSPGSVLYHYPDHDQMMLTVHQTLVNDYFDTRETAQVDMTAASEKLVSTVVAGFPPYADEKVIKALFEMHGLARRSAPHAELMTSLWEREENLYRVILAQGIGDGTFHLSRPIEEVAATLLALEDGLALHLVSNNSRLSPATAVRLFLLMSADLLGCPALADDAFIARTSGSVEDVIA